MKAHFFLHFLMTTTRQPEGKSTRIDVHLFELLLGSGGTGIQSSKSCPGSPKDQPRMGVDLLVRIDCKESSPEERQQKASAGSSLRKIMSIVEQDQAHVQIADICCTNCSGSGCMPTRAWLTHTLTKNVTLVYLAGVQLSLISAGTPCSRRPSKLTCLPTAG